MMDLISNLLLLAASLGAMAYCHTVARRLRKLSQLDQGVGRSIATLLLQVDDLKSALDAAKNCTQAAQGDLSESLKRAESARRHLELLIAAMQIQQKPQAEVAAKSEIRTTLSSKPKSQMEAVRVPWNLPEPLKLSQNHELRPNRVHTNKRARRLVEMALSEGATS